MCSLCFIMHYRDRLHRKCYQKTYFLYFYPFLNEKVTLKKWQLPFAQFSILIKKTCRRKADWGWHEIEESLNTKQEQMNEWMNNPLWVSRAEDTEVMSWYAVLVMWSFNVQWTGFKSRGFYVFIIGDSSPLLIIVLICAKSKKFTSTSNHQHEKCPVPAVWNRFF